MTRACAISRGEQSTEARGEIIGEITGMNNRAHDDDGGTVIDRSSSSFFP